MRYAVKGFNVPDHVNEDMEWATTDRLNEYLEGRPEVGPPRYRLFHDRLRGVVFRGDLPNRYLRVRSD